MHIPSNVERENMNREIAAQVHDRQHEEQINVNVISNKHILRILCFALDLSLC